MNTTVLSAKDGLKDNIWPSSESRNCSRLLLKHFLGAYLTLYDWRNDWRPHGAIFSTEYDPRPLEAWPDN
jgi:hypothetical protein